MKKRLLFTATAIVLCLILALPTLADLLFIEAESGTNADMQIIADASAYGGKYIMSDDKDVGEITYKFTVSEAGKYYIWARVWGDAAESNSYFYTIDGQSLDGQDYYVFDFYENSDYEVAANPLLPANFKDDAAVYSQWYWMPMSFRDQNADPNTRFNLMVFDFTAGEHVLLIKPREAGARLDKLIVTNDLTYNPTTIAEDPQVKYEADQKAAQESAQEVDAPKPADTPAVPSPKTADSAWALLALCAAALLGSVAITRRAGR